VDWFRNSSDSRNISEILAIVKRIEAGGKQMEASVQALIDQAAKNEAVEASALVVINGIAARLIAAGNDPVKLQQVVTDLQTSGNQLAAAVAANTVAAQPAA
jgi:hypothetical protein